MCLNQLSPLQSRCVIATIGRMFGNEILFWTLVCDKIEIAATSLDMAYRGICCLVIIIIVICRSIPLLLSALLRH